MANGKKLYSAYRGAGKAAASYKASLYDIENLGIEREGSRAMYEFESAQRDKNLALIQQGIGLASDIYGGYKAKKEAAADRSTIQEGMAKKAYEGDIKWDELSDKARQLEISKFAPTEVQRSLGEILTGSERKYTFGEGKDEFTSSQITAAASLYGENKLADMLQPKSKLEKAQESLEASVEKKEKENQGDTSIIAGKDDEYGVEEGAEYMVVPGFEELGITHDHTKDKETGGEPLYLS